MSNRAIVHCLALVSVLAVAACQNPIPPAVDAGPGDAGPADSGKTGVLGENLLGPSNCGQPPDPDGGVVAAVVQGNTALAVQLLHQLSTASGGGNVFYSPLSISTAMAMVYEGASGTTATQMAQYLDFTVDPADLAQGFGALACRLEADGQAPDGGQVDIANAVFGQQGDVFEAPFETTLQSSFGAPFTPVDFATDPDGVRQNIDAWVSQQTAGMIPELLQPGTVTPDMKLVLVDALYFNENWAMPFDPATMGAFHVTAQQTEQVPLMTDAVMNAGYFSASDAIVAEVPFQNGKEAIDFVLPGTGTATLTQLEAGLTATEIQGWVSGLTPQTVLVTLPKFKMDWSANLIPAFRALGVTLAFDSTQADFSGIDGQKDLFISLLQHEAVLDVNETGVTAAAATAVGIAGNAAPTWTATFAATQPFLVLIRDVPTGAVLFVGQVTNPSSG